MRRGAMMATTMRTAAVAEPDNTQYAQHYNGSTLPCIEFIRVVAQRLRRLHSAFQHDIRI